MIHKITSSIRYQLLVIIGMSMLLMTLFFHYGLSNSNNIIAGYQQLVDTDFELASRVGDLNVSFKTQVQEWKNVLLRGHNPDQLEKYWQRFNDKAQTITKESQAVLSQLPEGKGKDSLTAFIAVYPSMIEKYRIGYDAFIASGFDHKLGDASVKGIDREPSKTLLEAVEFINQDATNSAIALKQRFSNSVKFIFALISISSALILGLTLFAVDSRIVKPLQLVSTASKQLAQGNFTFTTPTSRQDEIGDVMNNVENIRLELGSLIKEVLHNIGQLNTFIVQTFGAIDDLGKNIESAHTKSTNLQCFLHNLREQSNDLFSGVTDNKTYVEETASDMKQKIQSYVSSQDHISNLDSVMINSMDKMDKLKDETDEISSLLNAIQSIAEQTNLLALNAAIEAARAGESGRGFAVVADEVRNLAHKTQESASKIEQTIGKLNDVTEEAHDSIKHSLSFTSSTSESLTGMIAFMHSTRDILDDIVAKQTELTSKIEEQINDAISVSDEADGAIAASMQTNQSNVELSAKTNLIKGVIDDIKTAAARFDLDNGSH